jgi:hypothetical protein
MFGFWEFAGTIVFLIVLFAGAVTAFKGRWGWFFLGLATGGIIWPLTATALAKPDSAWSESFYGPDKKARARRAFPAKPQGQARPASPGGPRRPSLLPPPVRKTPDD